MSVGLGCGWWRWNERLFSSGKAVISFSINSASYKSEGLVTPHFSHCGQLIVWPAYCLTSQPAYCHRPVLVTFYTGQARLGGGQVVAWLFFMSLLCSPPGVLTSMESLNSLSWAHFTIMQAGETGEYFGMCNCCVNNLRSSCTVKYHVVNGKNSRSIFKTPH